MVSLKLFRVFSVFLIAFLFCGCASKSDTVPILKGIEFKSKIKYYNENYECNTMIDQSGVMVIEVLSPESIEGMKLTLEPSKITAEYKGITYTPKTQTMPACNVAQIIYNVFEDVANNIETLSLKEENCVVNGKIDENEYDFTFSPSGLPLKLEISDMGFDMIFENVTISDSE